MDTIGERIKAAREEKGLSQDELAKKVGYKSRASINKIELGKTDVSRSRLEAIAKALDVSPTWLLGLIYELPNAKLIYNKERSDLIHELDTATDKQIHEVRRYLAFLKSTE